MRARARAVAAAAGAAIIVVPLTGAAAVALVATEPDGSTTQIAAESSLNYADAVAPIEAGAAGTVTAEVPAVVAAEEEVELTLDTPEVKVKENPKPVVVAPQAATSTSTSRSTSSARPVANSSSVAAAISGSAVIGEASKYVGTPYVGGGRSPGGFDCSGFISYVYGQLGISLPRSSGAYYNVGTRVSSPQPGDIIVTPGHVGIYAGKNLQIDAPRPGKSIQFRPIWQSNPVYVRVS
jgi:cell wall-associated NlpC family hydrolase